MTMRGWRATAMIGLLLMAPRVAQAQPTAQLWGSLTVDWVKSDRLVYELDFEPKVLVAAPEGDPGWWNLDLTPNVEYSPKGGARSRGRDHRWVPACTAGDRITARDVAAELKQRAWPVVNDVRDLEGTAVQEVFARFFGNLLDRVGGPMSFRLVLQPAVAAYFAIRAGIADARAGRPPYTWELLTNKDNRRALLRDGWKNVAKVFAMAVVIDAVYQFRQFGSCTHGDLRHG